MPTSFENMVTGLYNPTITTTGTTWSNICCTSAQDTCASAPVREEKEEEPTVFDVDKLIEEAE